MIADSLRKLGDVFTLQRGFDITKKEQSEGVYPVVSSSGINSYHNKYKVQGPGVVIGRKGTLGTTFYLESDYWPHDTSLWIKDFKGNNPKFLYYFLKKLPLEKLDSGSANPTLNRNFVHLIESYIPHVSVQGEIANILTDLDEKIELNNKINAELEAMAKLIYDYWFVQFDFPDANGKPYKSSGGKMVYNEELKREIPEGWDVGTLLDIADFTNGIACQKYRPEKNEDYYNVIKIREMGSGFTEKSEFISQNIPDKVVINNGDVLFSWSATLDVKIWSGGIGGLNQHIFKITSSKYPRTYYYFEVLRYLQHFKIIAELRKTTMGHITQDHLKQSRISIPPKDLIKALHEKIDPMLNKVVKGMEENLKIAELRDWLLPILMNGQVTVT
ncbi:Type I restriction-modification system, specificity subunit S [hydrothermal vent metagenome]|uniref:Type I restriction-modification system, specificity subunit S n=1 Tax=hydrothermal vent metagenome TaxID=652676 RepID=A0A3B0Y949_9ZZZZ